MPKNAFLAVLSRLFFAWALVKGMPPKRKIGLLYGQIVALLVYWCIVGALLVYLPIKRESRESRFFFTGKFQLVSFMHWYSSIMHYTFRKRTLLRIV